jgi:hypothetical protein
LEALLQPVLEVLRRLRAVPVVLRRLRVVLEGLRLTQALPLRPVLHRRPLVLPQPLALVSLPRARQQAVRLRLALQAQTVLQRALVQAPESYRNPLRLHQPASMCRYASTNQCRF